MNVTLDAIEARVIGCLMEKSMLTPDHYPLSLNALVNACNQKSSRDPVMNLSEGEVAAVLTALQRRYLVREKSGFGGRVPKYHYRLYNDEIGDFRFDPAERAVICQLLLRGPQTPGELRSRSGRMHEFADVETVEATLQRLAEYPQGPFVMRLAREPGRREARYAETFTAPEGVDHAPPAEAGAAGARAGTPAAAALPAAAEPRPREGGLEARVERLEQRLAALEAALAAMEAGRDSHG